MYTEVPAEDYYTCIQTSTASSILLAPHGAQAVIAFSHYSTSTTGYFPNILLKPLKTNV